MKQWLKELLRACWKYGICGIMFQAAQVACLILHKYTLASIFRYGVIFCMGLWGPYVEESFKRSHSSTISESLRFALVESIIYLPSAYFMGIGSYISARLPMFIMHSASGMCYHNHRRSRGVFYFWFICHSLWNTLANIKPELMYTLMNQVLVPTYLTMLVVSVWGFSLYRKIREAR